MKKLFIALIAVLLCTLTGTLVSAHSTLVRADPPPNAHLQDAPQTVTLWFDETLDRRFSSFSVLDAKQAPVDLKDVTFADENKQMRVSLKRNLPHGVYTVVYRALSAVDGHFAPASYSFVIGDESAPAASVSTPTIDFARLPSDVLVRAINLLAALALCGAFTLKLLMGDEDKDFAPLRRESAPRMNRWVLLNGALLLAGTLLAQIVQASIGSGSSLLEVVTQNVWLSSFTETRFGQAALARIILVASLFVLYVGAGPAVERWRIQRLWNVRTLDAAGFALASLILLSVSLSSHAAASSDSSQLPTLLDWLHLLAVGAWTGGLFALTVVLRAKATGNHAATIQTIVRRFSNVAIGSVVLFSITGLYSMWRQVASPAALTSTPYGESLIIKHLFITPMLVLGLLNTLWLRRNGSLVRWFARWLQQTSQRTNQQTHVLRNVRLEAALGVLAVLAAATMTALPPARTMSPPTGPAFATTRSGTEVVTTLKVDPLSLGNATFDVTLKDASGNVLRDVTRVSLRFTLLGSSLGTTTAEMQSVGDGTYRVKGNYLSVIGIWNIEPIIRRKDVAEDLHVPFRFEIADPASAQPSVLPEFNGGMIVALVVFFAGAVLLFAAMRRNLRAGKLFGSSALALGVALFMVSMAVAAPPVRTYSANPFAPDAVSLTRGKSIYDEHCAICHGPTGLGSELLPDTLRPTEFLTNTNRHSDDALFGFITNGMPNSGMAPWRTRLTDTQRWHVLNYVEYLASKSGGAPRDAVTTR